MLSTLRRFFVLIITLGTVALVVVAFLTSIFSASTPEELAAITQIAVRATMTAHARMYPSETIVFALSTDTASEPPAAPMLPTPSASATLVPPEAGTVTATLPITPSTITSIPDNASMGQATLPASTGITGQPTAVMHVVQLRESLFRISQQYSVSVEAIIAANGLPDPNRIFVGQALLIPVGGTVLPPAQTATTSYPAQATALALVSAGASFSDSDLDMGFRVTPTPTYPPPPTTVNGLSIDAFVLMSDDVKANIRAIYARGQALGRNPHAFSKLGDSTIENPHFMVRFDAGEGPYHLGDYAYLQAVIDTYQGSFSRQGLAVRRGLHTWSVLDSMWAPKPTCGAGEHMLACEFRVHNPGILFVRMGSNDAGIPNSTDKNLREIVEFCLENGVIPIMGTKADRFEGADNINNRIIRQIALDYALPLWDFDLVAGTLPGRGLGPDRVHMTTFFAHDWRSPLGFQTGNGIHSLTGLIVLDRVWRVIEGEE